MNGTLVLPTTIKNLTIVGAANHTSVIKNGKFHQNQSNFNIEGLRLEGIVFDDVNILIVPWDGNSFVKDFVVTNCVFQNLDDNDTIAPIHVSDGCIENFTFTNNVVKNLTGGDKSGLYIRVTGNVNISNNIFDTIQFRPALVKILDADGISDNIVISNNVMANTTRLQVYGSEIENSDGTYTPSGTDTLEITITDNIFKNITSSYYICTWGINGEYDISENYFDGDISGRIYWNNEKPTDESGLKELGVYPIYKELNSDGTINTESAYTPANYTAMIGTVGYATLAEAIEAAKAAGIVDLVITLVGTTTPDTSDSINLYEETAFNSITLKQADPSVPYYICEFYTGKSTGDGQFVLDGVNIVITDQFITQRETVLKNNSVVTRTNDVKNFIYYADMYIEPGSQYNGVIDDILGGKIEVDGGKADGTFNDIAGLTTTYFDVRGGQVFVLKNGAYAIVKNVDNSGGISLNGLLKIQQSKVVVGSMLGTDGITLGANGWLSLDWESVVEAGRLQGAGVVTIDLTGYTGNGFVAVSGNTSNFNGIVELEGNNGNYVYEIAPNGIVIKRAAASVNGVGYATIEEAFAAAQAGDEIVLLADIDADITVPAGVILNGNGKQVGRILAEGNITFMGIIKAYDFDVQYTNTTINIVEGACLELYGTDRLVVGHGCTFNITGTITDAKATDKATVQPSLIVAAGASFTGTNLTFNVTNAYVKFNANSTSKNSNANGTFNFNITNSIWEQTGVLAFYVPTGSMDPTFNLNLKNSVLNTSSHLVFSVTKGEIVFDNSNVNVGVYRQLENRSTLTIKNGSVVYAAYATSSNAKNPGTTIVENAKLVSTGEFTGSELGTGTLVIKSGADISLGTITKANIVVDAADMVAGAEIKLTANLSNLIGTITTINNDTLEAEVVDGKLVLVEKPVAKIGEVEYLTLEDAIAAAQAGGEVVLLKNVELAETLVIAAGAEITLDLNGKTINVAYVEGSTTNHIYAFENHGTVTITGNGVINTRGIFNYGKLTLENGTINAIDGNGGYAVLNYAGSEFIMNGGKVAAIYEDDNLVDKGGYDATPIRVESGATFTMNAGEVANVSDFTYAIDNVGTTIIIGGTVTSVHSTLSNNGNMTVKGGEFTCNGLEGVTAHVIVAWGNSVTTIEGGTFNGKDNYNGFNVDAVAGANVAITGGKFLGCHSGSLYGNGNITVSGGEFFDSVPENRCAEGYIPTENADGTYGVKEGSYVAEVNGVKYESLADALAAAVAGDEIVLLAPIVVKEGETLELDLAGKIISMVDATGKTAALIYNYGNLTIKDTVGGGKLTFNSTTPSANNGYACNVISNYGNVTILSGTIENTTVGGACYALDNYAGSTATISGGKLVAEKTTVRIFNWTNGEAAKATLNITGGEIYSKDGYGVNINSGNAPYVALNITGGTIKTDDTDYNLAVYVVNKGTAENFTANVTGGEFGGMFALNGVTSTTMSENAITVSGGTFEGVICYGTPAYGFVAGGVFGTAVEDEFCVTGYIPTENADGTYGVKEGSYVAEVGGVKYESLADALNAATENSEIVLLDNLTLDAMVQLTKAITLNLGGYTLEVNAKKGIEVHANVTIKNGTVKAIQRAVDTRTAVELTLDGVTLVANTYTSYGNPQPLTIGGSTNGTKVTLNNCTLDAGTAGYAIITFVETELTATDSTFTGFSALYVKPGSENSTFSFANCDLIGTNGDNDVAGNSFSTIAVRADNVTVNVDKDSTVSAVGNYFWAISLGSEYAGKESTTGVKVTVAGTISGQIFSSGSIDGNSVAVQAQYAENLLACGYASSAVDANGMITVIGRAEVKIGDKVYTSFDAALADATAGQTIVLVGDVDYTTIGNGVIAILKNINIDLNGYTLTANAFAQFAGGGIVDNGEVKGLLAVPNGMLMLNRGTYPMLPVWNESGTGYVLFNVKPQIEINKTGDSSFQIVTRPSINSGGVANEEVFGDGIDDNGLKFQIAIKYVKDGKILDNITEIFTFSDALVKTVYSEDKAMALNVGGATDAYDSYIVELIVASDTGVTYTYTDDTLVFVPTVSTETEPEEQ